jgi:hypothetical protein
LQTSYWEWLSLWRDSKLGDDCWHSLAGYQMSLENNLSSGCGG